MEAFLLVGICYYISFCHLQVLQTPFVLWCTPTFQYLFHILFLISYWQWETHGWYSHPLGGEQGWRSEVIYATRSRGVFHAPPPPCWHKMHNFELLEWQWGLDNSWPTQKGVWRSYCIYTVATERKPLQPMRE